VAPKTVSEREHMKQYILKTSKRGNIAMLATVALLAAGPARAEDKPTVWMADVMTSLGADCIGITDDFKGVKDSAALRTECSELYNSFDALYKRGASGGGMPTSSEVAALRSQAKALDKKLSPGGIFGKLRDAIGFAPVVGKKSNAKKNKESLGDLHKQLKTFIDSAKPEHAAKTLENWSYELAQDGAKEYATGQVTTTEIATGDDQSVDEMAKGNLSPMLEKFADECVKYVRACPATGKTGMEKACRSLSRWQEDYQRQEEQAKAAAGAEKRDPAKPVVTLSDASVNELSRIMGEISKNAKVDEKSDSAECQGSKNRLATYSEKVAPKIASISDRVKEKGKLSNDAEKIFTCYSDLGAHPSAVAGLVGSTDASLKEFTASITACAGKADGALEALGVKVGNPKSGPISRSYVELFGKACGAIAASPAFKSLVEEIAKPAPATLQQKYAAASRKFSLFQELAKGSDEATLTWSAGEQPLKDNKLTGCKLESTGQALRCLGALNESIAMRDGKFMQNWRETKLDDGKSNAWLVSSLKTTSSMRDLLPSGDGAGSKNTADKFAALQAVFGPKEGVDFSPMLDSHTKQMAAELSPAVDSLDKSSMKAVDELLANIGAEGGKNSCPKILAALSDAKAVKAEGDAKAVFMAENQAKAFFEKLVGTSATRPRTVTTSAEDGNELKLW
jgi:hypothetical protein